jgi:hypothetical protein
MSGSGLGLSIDDVVNVTISLTPSGAVPRNFGACMIIGGSGIISTSQRFRSYTSIPAVALDFGGSTPEYLAAVSFFSQSPQPSQLYIGAWSKNPSHAVLQGGVLSPSQQLLSNFTGITTGTFQITVSGTAMQLVGLNFSTASNLNAVAAVVQAAITAEALSHTFIWNASLNSFQFTTSTSGAGVTVTYASATGLGVDISALLGLTAATGASITNGAVGETPLAALQALAAKSSDWYMGGFADTSVTNTQHEANSAYIEALFPTRVYGITIQDPEALDPASTTDLAYLLNESGYTRTVCQFSSYNPYAIFSFFGRFATIAYSSGNNVAITGKFQTEPGTQFEVITESQAAALNAKCCNVFVEYQNGIAILQQAFCSSGLFFDIRQGADWLQNQAQTDLFNAFVQAGTKIPQTDAGMNKLTTTLAGTLSQGVNNGLIAPGQWNAPGFGSLQEGQYLTSGYYIYTPSISSQSEAVRQTRAAPLMQTAVKLAGAIHSANVAITINQ